MEILDATVITTALPVIAADFNVPAAHLSIGVSAYLVAVTLFIPLSGYAADKFGARTIFVAAIAVFTFASVLCGLSTSLFEFTLSRILQGLGGAMMVPVGRLVVLRDLPKEKLVKTVAIITWPALSAPLLGPVLGGYIATHFSWQWIFYMNIPLGIIAIIASLYLLKNIKGNVGKFDIKGFLLTGIGFALFMAGIEFLASTSNKLIRPLGIIAIGLVLMVLAVKHVKTAKNPLFSFDAMQHKTFRLTVFGGSVMRVARQCTVSCATHAPAWARLLTCRSRLTVAVAVCWKLSDKASDNVDHEYLRLQTRACSKRRAHRPWFCGCMINHSTSSFTIAVILFVNGITRSMHLTLINTIAFADVPQ